MELELTVEADGQDPRHVAGRVGEHTTVGELRSRVGPREVRMPRPGMWIGERHVPDAVPVRAAGLLNGSRVGLGGPIHEPATGRPTAPAGLRLSVVGGLHGGRSVPLVPGRDVVAGRGHDCALRVPDPEMSWRHASFRPGQAPAGERGRYGWPPVVVRDEASLNGVDCRRGRWPVAALLDAGDTVRLGETILQAETVAPVVADLTAEPDAAGLAFNRPPHIPEPRNRPVLDGPRGPSRRVVFASPGSRLRLRCCSASSSTS